MREDLVKNFCSRELTSYRQIFEGAGLSDLIFGCYFISVYVISVCSMALNSKFPYFCYFTRTGKVG